MSDWTAERLNSLPEGTVIQIALRTFTARLTKRADGYWDGASPKVTTQSLMDRNPVSITVFAVPVAALLESERVLDAASDGLMVAPIRSHIESVIGGPL